MRPSQQRHLTRAGSLIAALAAMAGSLAIAVAPSSASPDPYQGSPLRPVVPRPSGVLTDTSGRAFDLGAGTRGTVTLLYFGYTSCPDLCPTTLADVHQALGHVSSQVRARTRVVFVSVDPARDSAARIRTWLDGFDPAYIGLRGPIEQVIAVGDSIGAGVAKPGVTAGGAADVQHTSVLFGISPAGGIPVFWLPSTDGRPVLQTQLEHDLPLLLAGLGT